VKSGGVLVFCNGASISLLDESIGYQAMESLLFIPVETFGLFHAPPGDDVTKDRQFFVGNGDGFSHLTLHRAPDRPLSIYFRSLPDIGSAADHITGSDGRGFQAGYEGELGSAPACRCPKQLFTSV
jgi:hypothetical protein